MVIDVTIMSKKNLFKHTTKADSVILPVPDGSIGILENMSYLGTIISMGLVKMKINGIWIPILVHEGLGSIRRNQLYVLVEEVEEFQKIDVDLPTAQEELKELALMVQKGKIADYIPNVDDLVRRLRRARARVEGLKCIKESGCNELL